MKGKPFVLRLTMLPETVCCLLLTGSFLHVIPPSSIHSLDTITCLKYIWTNLIISFIPFYVSHHESHTLIPTGFWTFLAFSLLSIISKISSTLVFFLNIFLYFVLFWKHYFPCSPLTCWLLSFSFFSCMPSSKVSGESHALWSKLYFLFLPLHIGVEEGFVFHWVWKMGRITSFHLPSLKLVY